MNELKHKKVTCNNCGGKGYIEIIEKDKVKKITCGVCGGAGEI